MPLKTFEIQKPRCEPETNEMEESNEGGAYHSCIVEPQKKKKKL